MSYQYTATSAVLDISTLCLCVCHYVRYVDTHSHVEGNEAATHRKGNWTVSGDAHVQSSNSYGRG